MKNAFPRSVAEWSALLLTTAIFSFAALIVPTPVWPASSARDADKLLVVDCMLPGQVRRLGSGVTYLTPRRPIKTSASTCEIRGGEYTAYDRANFATALKIWLPQAKDGDAKAQTYVGEIFEKGLGVAPDYETAAAWYRKAAEQGHSAAQINLGSLYERGLGVPRDPTEALNWFRRASGLVGDTLVFASTLQETVSAKDQEIATLRAESEQRRAQAEALTQKLTQAERALKESKRDLRSTRSKLGEIRSQLQRNQEPATDTRAKEAELKRLQDTIQRRDAELEAQRAKIASIESKLAQRDAAVDRLQRDTEQQQALLQKQLRTSERELADLRSSLEQAERQLRGSQAQLRRETRDAALSEKLELAEQRSVQLEDQLRAHEAHTRTLRRDLEEAQRKLDLTRAQMQQAGTKESEVTARLAETETEKRQISSKLEGARAQARATQDLLVEARTELARALSSARSDNASLVRRIEAQAADKDRMEARLLAQEQERESVQQQIATLQQDLALSKLESERRQNELLSQKIRFDAEREKLQQARNGLMAQLREEKADSERERSAMEKKLAEQEARYAQALKEQERRVAEQERLYDALKEQISGQDREPEETLAAAGDGPTIELIDPPLAFMRGTENPFATLRSDIDYREIVGRVTAPSGLLAFSINDRNAEISDNGMFKIEVPIADEETQVRLVAVDTQGRRSSLDFVLKRQDVQPVAVPESGRPQRPLKVPGLGRYHALVIGNNSYKGGMQKLSAARNDAEEIEKILKQRYGFKTKLLLDADRYEIMSALNALRENLTDDDNLLIYFAGHGVIEKTASGEARGYWLPVDAEPNNNANWISNTAVTEIIETIPAKHVLIVADSCYSGTLSSAPVARVLPDMPTEAKLRHIGVLAKARARIVIASGGLRPVIDHVGGKHSVFAQAFLETLQGNPEVIDVWGLYRSIRERMQRVTRQLGIDQEPQYAAMKHAGHGGGVFFFSPS